MENAPCVTTLSPTAFAASEASFFRSEKRPNNQPGWPESPRLGFGYPSRVVSLTSLKSVFQLSTLLGFASSELCSRCFVSFPFENVSVLALHMKTHRLPGCASTRSRRRAVSLFATQVFSLGSDRCSREVPHLPGSLH